MGEMFDFLDQLARFTLEALLNSVWQGMLITGLVWVSLRVARGASATTRHAFWMIALLTIAALPFLALPAKFRGPAAAPATKPDRAFRLKPALPPLSETAPAQISAPQYPMTMTSEKKAAAPQAPLSHAARPMNPPERASIVQEPQNIAPAPVAVPATPIAAQSGVWTTLISGRAPAAIFGLWLAFAFLMLTRILRSYLSIYQLRRGLGPAKPEQQRRVELLAATFGIKRAVGLFISPRAPMPMTVGSWSPVIILPPGLAESLSESELDSITAHELAHIKRWDYLLNLLQRTIQAVLFFHPAVWFIGKQLLIERELACDDWAVKTCEPRSYASCLTRLVEALNKSNPRTAVRLAAAGILFGKHVITRRVEMILNRERNSTTAVSKSALLYALGLALSFLVVCSLLQPVIAVPVGQKPAKPQAPKTPKPPTTPQPASENAPLPPTPPEASAAPELPEPPEAPESPVALEPIALEDDILPPPAVAPISADEEIPVIAPAAVAPVYIASSDLLAPIAPARAQSPKPAPAPKAEPAVLASPVKVWAQDDKNRKPAIPEDELISVLTEIVKKDADPAVRSEALQGIYRSRSDAAINALLSLYDSVGDVKVKGEIIPYLIRREGDNAKAIAKLMNIAKSEPNEDLRNRAIRYLGAVRGDDGAANLVQIYDSLQDQKAKVNVIRSLGANKSRKAVDKLILIAKNDTDPNVRMSAIRALNGIDNRYYLDMLDGKPAKVGTTLNGSGFNFNPNADAFYVDKQRWEEAAKEMSERSRDLLKNNWFDGFQNFNFDDLKFDQPKFDEMFRKLELELPRLRLRLKDIEDGKINQNRFNEVRDVEAKLAAVKAVLTSQLAKQRATLKEKNPRVQQTQSMIDSIEKDLALARQLKTQPTLEKRPVRTATLIAPGRAVVVRTSVN